MPALDWPRLLILCSALALHNILRSSPVTLVDELRARYGVDYTGVGNVIGAYTLAYGGAQLTAGLLSARAGPRRLLLVGLALAAGGSALFALTMQVVWTSERFTAVGAGAAIGLINSGGQLAASLGGPLYGAMLDREWGFGAVWGTAIALGVVRLGAVLLLRERARG